MAVQSRGFVYRPRRWLGTVSRAGVRWLIGVCLLSFFLFPLYCLTANALETPDEADALPVHLIPSRLYWGNFAFLLQHFPLGRNLLNSVIVATSTTLIVMLLAAMAAYSLAKLPLPGRRAFLAAVVLLLCFPGIALVPSLYLMLRSEGLLNTYAALILPYCGLGLPLAVWILSNAFGQISTDLIAQAEVDGCTPLRALLRVVLPLAMPAISTAALLVFIGAWSEYLFALTYMFQPSMMTLSVVMAGFSVGHGFDSAVVLVVTMPLIVLVILAQGRLIQGLSAGAVR